MPSTSFDWSQRFFVCTWRNLTNSQRLRRLRVATRAAALCSKLKSIFFASLTSTFIIVYKHGTPKLHNHRTHISSFTDNTWTNYTHSVSLWDAKVCWPSEVVVAVAVLSEEPPLQASGRCLVGAHEEPNTYANTNTDSQPNPYADSNASVEPWELPVVIIGVPTFRVLHAGSVHIIVAFIASSLPKQLIMINRNLRDQSSQTYNLFMCILIKKKSLNFAKQVVSAEGRGTKKTLRKYSGQKVSEF